MGGFLPENNDEGACTNTGYPDNPNYSNATAVVLTFLVNNFDAGSDDPAIIMQLEKAKAWEEVFVAFMKNWTSDPKNSMYMDVAYNSERSIEDELDRETYGDIMTIAVSYIFMFIYITFRFVNFLILTLTSSQTNNFIPACKSTFSQQFWQNVTHHFIQIQTHYDSANYNLSDSFRISL